MIIFGKRRIVPLLTFTIVWTAVAQDYNFIFGNRVDIPDQNPFGITDAHNINTSSGAIIKDIDISLTIGGTGSGGFNGDLFVTLQHGSGFAVLLNRPGARPGAPSGYGDSGINVTFDDSFSQDIHSYRLVLAGDENKPVPGGVTGTWSPDGRNVDPGIVSPSSPRTSLLDSFSGLSLDGTWSLFVSDLSSGGTQQLEGWSIHVQTVPEPAPLAIGALFVLIVFTRACFQIRRRGKHESE